MSRGAYSFTVFRVAAKTHTKQPVPSRHVASRAWPRSASGAWNAIANTSANVTTYKDGAVTSGTTYFYRVRPFGTAGDFVDSSIASAMP